MRAYHAETGSDPDLRGVAWCIVARRLIAGRLNPTMASDDDDLVQPKHMNFATTGDWSNNIAPRPIARVNRRELLKLGAALTVSPSLPATAAPAPGRVLRVPEPMSAWARAQAAGRNYITPKDIAEAHQLGASALSLAIEVLGIMGRQGPAEYAEDRGLCAFVTWKLLVKEGGGL